MSSDVSSPEAIYEARLRDRQQTVDTLSERSNRLATLRGLVFFLGFPLAVFLMRDYGLWWIIPLVVVTFIGLVIGHHAVRKRIDTASRAVAVYREGMARIVRDWVLVPDRGLRYANPQHLYADDLDLFGPRSLFAILSATRSSYGERRLANWLREPADHDVVIQRQAAAAEIRSDLDLQERLAVLPEMIEDASPVETGGILHTWAERSVSIPKPVRLAVMLFSAIGTVALIAFLLALIPLGGLLLGLLPLILIQLGLRSRIQSTLGETERVLPELANLTAILEFIETGNWEADGLQKLHGQTRQNDGVASREIRRLERLMQWMRNSLENLYFVPIAALLGLPIHLTAAINRWREQHRLAIPDWLDAVAEFEALTSLGRFAFENPTFVQPELKGRRCLIASEAAHPLLSPKVRVANEIELTSEQPLLLISGSNMSGKSTLLRTVGMNTVLSLAGAVVCASRFVIGPVRLGTELRVQDSLASGESLFYAVITRLKQVVDLANGDRPLLFLLDEILQGTNSHDRRTGAEAIIRGLVERDGIGIVTTHDLALTSMADRMHPPARNMHLRDELTDGKMTFDYQLRPGVVETSNALELMRLVGLDVPSPTAEETPSETASP